MIQGQLPGTGVEHPQREKDEEPEQQLTDRLPWQLGQITGVVEDVVPT